MATPAMIAIRNDDGSLVAIRCNYDGHPLGVGATLMKSWGNETRARSLIKLGDLSRLGKVVGRQRPFDLAAEVVEEYTDEEGLVNWGEAMSVKRMVEHNRACLSLKRDRGDEDADPVSFGGWKIFSEAMFGCCGQSGPGYTYVFDVQSSEWFGAKNDSEVNDFADLAPVEQMIAEYGAELEAQGKTIQV